MVWWVHQSRLQQTWTSSYLVPRVCQWQDHFAPYLRFVYRYSFPSINRKYSILGSWFYRDPFWAVDSTETHFGQWILQRPILGSGFYKDPFWAVNSFYKDPVWAVDSTPQCGNFMNFLSFRFHVKLILGGSRSAKSALLTHLEAFEFGFLWLFAFLKAETHQKMSFRALKNWINDSFRTSRPAKIDFT